MDIAMTLTTLEGMVDALKTKAPKERVQALATLRGILQEFYNYVDRTPTLREVPGALDHIEKMLESLRIEDKDLAQIQEATWLRHHIAHLRSRKGFNVY